METTNIESLAHTTDSRQPNCTNHTTCCATYQPQLTLITRLKRIALHIVPQRGSGERQAVEAELERLIEICGTPALAAVRRVSRWLCTAHRITIYSRVSVACGLLLALLCPGFCLTLLAMCVRVCGCGCVGVVLSWFLVFGESGLRQYTGQQQKQV